MLVPEKMHLTDYSENIESLKKASECEYNPLLRQHLQEAVALLQKIDEERNSLWFLLDEINKSDMQNHADFIMEEMQKKIAQTRMSVSKKVGLV